MLTVLVVNLFVITLLADTLWSARQHQEDKARQTVQDLALLMDQNTTIVASAIALVLKELASNLEDRIQCPGYLASHDITALLTSRQSWMPQADPAKTRRIFCTKV